MRVKIAACLLVVMALFGLPYSTRVSADGPRVPASIDRRVDELLSQMTIEEKVGPTQPTLLLHAVHETRDG